MSRGRGTPGSVPALLTRFVGFVLLTVAIGASSCQAVFQHSSSVNAPEQLSPTSFQHGR